MMTIQRPLYFYVVEVDLSPDIFSFDYGVWDIVCGIHSHFQGVTELDIYVTLL